MAWGDKKTYYPHQSNPKFSANKNYYVMRKTRFVLTDRLDKKSKQLKQPRLCSKHLVLKPLKTKVSLHSNKKHVEKLEMHPVSDSSGHKNSVISNLTYIAKGKGIGVDRHNHIFYNKLDGNEKLGLQLSTAAYSPEREKRGYEKIIKDPVNGARKKLKFDDEIQNTTTRHYNLKNDSFKRSRKPHVTPGNMDDEIKRRTGFLSEKHMLLYSALLCNENLEEMLKYNSKLTWYEEWFMFSKYFGVKP